MDTHGKHVSLPAPPAVLAAVRRSLSARGAVLALLCRNLEKGEALNREIVVTGAATPRLVHIDLVRLPPARKMFQRLLKISREPGRVVRVWR